MTTIHEFLESMKSRGATIAPPPDAQSVILANTNLGRLRAALLPPVMKELYAQCAGLHMGSGYIFGPCQIPNNLHAPIPSIVEINTDIANIESMRGKTVVGRNDLFWFAFDAFGKFMLLDNATLKTLRTYDDPLRAISDCLIAGKI